MKTQRRHQLESNKLAEWLTKNAEQYKSHARTITIVAVGAIAIFFAALIYRSTRAATDGAAWRSFYNAFTTERSSPEALIAVANNYGESKVALWAKQSAADSQLAQGMTRLYTDREEAMKFLRDAEKNLKEVEAGAAGSPVVLERARFGLGQAYESMSEVEQARKYYGLVASTAPSSALGKVAAKRREALGDPQLEQWYAWFAQQKPKVPQINPLGTGSPPLGTEGRESLKNLPKTSDLPSLEKQFAVPPSSTKKKTDGPAEQGPPSDPTSPEEPPSLDDNPAEAPPAPANSDEQGKGDENGKGDESGKEENSGEAPGAGDGGGKSNEPSGP